jgi:uncharacterized protein
MSRERVVSAVHGFYRRVLSPFLHAAGGVTGACRFQPTCSEYAAIAVSEWGLLRGGWMALRRLLHCHPFHRGGFDPVPAKANLGLPKPDAGALGVDAPEQRQLPLKEAALIHFHTIDRTQFWQR